MPRCQFCEKDWGHPLMPYRGKYRKHVKYAPRHWAHPDCALAHFGVELFEKLSMRDLENFPASAARELNLLDALMIEIERRRL